MQDRTRGQRTDNTIGAVSVPPQTPEKRLSVTVVGKVPQAHRYNTRTGLDLLRKITTPCIRDKQLEHKDMRTLTLSFSDSCRVLSNSLQTGTVKSFQGSLFKKRYLCVHRSSGFFHPEGMPPGPESPEWAPGCLKTG